MSNPALGFRLGVQAALETMDWRPVERVVEELRGFQYHAPKRVYIAGNGGSGANAAHFAQDLFSAGVPAVSLLEPGMVTMIGNDYGYERVFEKQLHRYGQVGDMFIGISCSGNSPNVYRAAEWAARNNLILVEVTGATLAGKGGKLGRDGGEFHIHVPSPDYGICESVHSTVFHYIVKQLMSEKDRE